MEKMLALVLTIFMVIGMMPVGVIAAEEEATETVTEDTSELLWEYELYGEGVALTNYLGSSTDVFVPSKIEVNGIKYVVIKLGDSIFEDNDALNSVTLGDGITEIGDRAFYDADNLVTIVTNEQLTTIGAEAFYSCDSFNSIILYDAVTSIGADAFAACPNLTVWCNEGTAGCEYATENGIDYEILKPEATPETFVQDGITYYIMNGEAVAISFDQSTTKVVIPSTVAGYPVTEIHNEAFSMCSELTSVIFSDNLKKIGDNAFSECWSLGTVVFPDSIKFIGNGAFNFCNPITNLNLPEGLISIGDYAFNMCTWLDGFTLPDSLQYLGSQAFSSCNIKEVVIPEGITTLYDTFAFCYDLESVILPKTLESISRDAFLECYNLKEITIPKGVSNISPNAFNDQLLIRVTENSYAHSYALQYHPNFVLTPNTEYTPYYTTIDGVKYYIANDVASVVSYDNSLTSINILPSVDGATVTSIYEEAFAFCRNLKSVTMPNSVKTIGSYAFWGCSSLVSVNIPSSVAKIDSYTFSGCEKLTDITIEYGVQDVGQYAFNNCKSLAKINIPSSVKIINTRAFYDCASLNTVTLNEGLSLIGDGAFTNCYSLKEIQIPKSVKSFSYSAFPYKTVLLVYEGSYAHTYYSKTEYLYTIIGQDNYELLLVNGIEFFVSSEYAIAIDYYGSDVNVVIPEKVNGVPVVKLIRTFEDCGFITSVSLPESLNTISSRAFYRCSKIKEIIIPESVSKIRDNAFYGCSSLTEILIPGNVNTIDSNAFASCGNLRKITISEGVKTIGSGAFLACNLDCVVIPNSVTSMSSNVFSENIILLVFEDSYAMQYAEKHEYLHYVIDKGEASESSTCDVLEQGDFVYLILGSDAIAIGYNGTQTQVNVPDTVNGVPVIGLINTFYMNKEIISVILPDSLKFIGDYTFCSSEINDVILPNNLESIGQFAFEGCMNLTSISLPNNIKTIEEGTFRNCLCLTEIEFPKQLEVITDDAFSGCFSLAELNLPDTVTYIGNNAFSSLWDLKEFNAPSNLTFIGSDTFSGCYSLERVKLNSKLNEIGANAFYETAITEINLPENLKIIGDGAFYSCQNIKKVIIPNSVSRLATTSFSTSTILMVQEDSYAHNYAKDNGLLYFIIRKTENPEISFGTGISGAVTYTDGTPAVGANVEIIYDDGVFKETVDTDENGAYEFTYAEVGAYTIRATDAEGNTFAAHVSVKRMNAFDVFLEGDTALTLKKGYKVSGTVSVGGATVTVTDEDANVITSVTADENGNFVIENLPNGTYVFTATTEQGSASTEVTVYNGDVDDLTLTIATETVFLWGYVEVEDRDFNHHRRNWVEITVYNEDGVAVARTKSDGDGKYTFSGLPTGEYSIVAETVEMRPDKKHGFDRSFTLTGYAYVVALSVGEYKVDTIVLYEENDHTATISGKVTANGQVNNSTVRLVNVFRHEVAEMTTKSNGKYSFTNIRDGLYFIIATTENDGMGMAVVTVRDGEVYGQTDIMVLKSDKIKYREDRFRNDVPDFDDRDGIGDYRERIADEKHFYDGLSEKEKKQLSRDYVERLNKYCEWLADTEYTSDDGVVVDGGLVLSADEIAKSDTVSFELTVNKTEEYEASTDGVKNGKDHKHHKMKDTAGEKDIVQYYEITMSKTVDGEEKAITSVYKDTDATGKFRITLSIPEEYRGHTQYTMLHEHHGEVVTLADLDDDPNTITVEVDRFSTFALATSDESNIGDVGADFGDANADGVINIIDMSLTAQYIAQGGIDGTYDLSACDVTAMDANADGVIDQLDLNDIAAIIRA